MKIQQRFWYLATISKKNKSDYLPLFSKAGLVKKINSIAMKQFYYTISCLMAVLCLWSACDPDLIKPDGYVDETLLDEWTLESFEDLEGNVVHEKSIDLPRDIILVFRQGGLLSGNVVSFSIDAKFGISKKGKMKLSNLVYPDLPLCCDWDEYFFEAQEQVHQYEINDNNELLLYYDDDEPKIMRFSSSKFIEQNYIDYNLLWNWRLLEFRDTSGNIIHQKPEDEPGAIFLSFRKDNILSGNYLSYSFGDGYYKIDKNSNMELMPPVNSTAFCCKWDSIFLDAVKLGVNKYISPEGRYLIIYYDNSSKKMLFFR